MSYSHNRAIDNHDQMKEQNFTRFDKHDRNNKFENTYINKINKYLDGNKDNSLNLKNSDRKFSQKENSGNQKQSQHNSEEKKQKEKYISTSSYSDNDSYSSYSSEDSKERKSRNLQKRRYRSRSRSQDSSSSKSSSSRSKSSSSQSSSSSYKAIKRSPKNIQAKLVKKSEHLQLQYYPSQTPENFQGNYKIIYY